VRLKNRTSDAPISRTISKIEEILIRSGATNIIKSYSNGILTAVSFQIPYNNKLMPIKLPANTEACYKVLMAEVKKPRPGTEDLKRKQAEKTAWKIIQDWIEIQMSMILLKQAEPLEIFMPFIYDAKKDMTFYNLIKNNHQNLLPA
jgi:hypothetical protein